MDIVIELICGLAKRLVLASQLLNSSLVLAKLRKKFFLELCIVDHDAQQIESFLVVNFLNCNHQLLELISSLLPIEFCLSLNHLL